MCDRWLHTAELLIAYCTAFRAGLQKNKDVVFLCSMTEFVDCRTKCSIQYLVFDVVCNGCATLLGTKKSLILFIRWNNSTVSRALCYCFFYQVSAEPEGGSYVFQGFIQGKDYGQFGLQRVGMCLFQLVTHTIFDFHKSKERDAIQTSLTNQKCVMLIGNEWCMSRVWH